MSRQVVIDCDPGIDDALALLMAFASDKLEVRGITAVAGNVPVEKTAENALRLAALAGCSVEVAAGAEKPLYAMPRRAEKVHGDNGLGGIVLPPGRTVSSRGAVEFLRDEIAAARGELEIITLGPLTNIARLLMKYPETAGQIKNVIMMGGALKGGNATPRAEFNFYADPHAASLVFRSGIPLEMYGLDVTNRAILFPDEVEAVEGLGGPVMAFIAPMMEWYLNFYRSVGHPGLGMHDPFAVACAIDPSLAVLTEYPLEIVTQEGEFFGSSVIPEEGTGTGTPNVRAAVELDRERFVRLFMDLMKTYASFPINP